MDSSPRATAGPRAPKKWLAVGFVTAIVLLQAAAIARQFQLGFIPFVTVPTRVPFSWDMFSIPIERCGIAWEPELQLGERRVPTLRSLAPALEWDPVYNTVQDYLAAARFGCNFRRAPTIVKLTCASKLRVFSYAFACPE